MYTTVSFLVSRLPELGDDRAWGEFEGRYTPMLQRYFRKAGCRQDVAGDLAQDTLRRIADGLVRRQYRREAGRLRDWIGGIARNVLRNHFRKRRERSNLDAEGQAFWEAQEDAEAAGAIVRADERFDAVWVRARMRELLRLAARTFDRHELQIYFLLEIHKRTVSEVAARTGFSPSAVFQKRRKVANWMLAVGPRIISNWEQ